MGLPPPWLAWVIWLAIGLATAVMLLVFWWQGTLGHFFHGLATVPPVK